MKRILKNGIWYYVVLNAGYLFGHYAPLDWTTIVFMFFASIGLYIVISNVRSVVKF